MNFVHEYTKNKLLVFPYKFCNVHCRIEIQERERCDSVTISFGIEGNFLCVFLLFSQKYAYKRLLRNEFSGGYIHFNTLILTDYLQKICLIRKMN